MPLTRERIQALALQVATADAAHYAIAGLSLDDFRELLNAAERDLDVRELDEWIDRHERGALVITAADPATDHRWCCGLHGRNRQPLGYLGPTGAAARHAAAEAVRKDGGG